MADELVSRITGQAIAGCDTYGVPNTGGDPARRPPPAASRSRDPHRRGRLKVTDERYRRPGADNARHVDDRCQRPASPCGRRQHAGHSAAAGPDLETTRGWSSRTPSLQPMRRPAAEPDHDRPHPVRRRRRTGAPDRTRTDPRAAGPRPGHRPRRRATTTWVRRLYTDPSRRQLVAMDSRQRLFPAGAQRFLIARDQTCRTPWCDAPIRHIDHVVPHSQGGPTSTRQRARPVRSLQSEQTGTRLAKPRPAERRHPHHHTHRPHLPEPGHHRRRHPAPGRTSRASETFADLGRSRRCLMPRELPPELQSGQDIAGGQVDLVPLLASDGDISGSDALGQPVQVHRARDRLHLRWMPQQPGNRHGRRGHLVSRRHLVDGPVQLRVLVATQEDALEEAVLERRPRLDGDVVRVGSSRARCRPGRPNCHPTC